MRPGLFRAGPQMKGFEAIDAQLPSSSLKPMSWKASIRCSRRSNPRGDRVLDSLGGPEECAEPVERVEPISRYVPAGICCRIVWRVACLGATIAVETVARTNARASAIF